MRVFRDIAGACLATSGSVVTVGAFDGLHLGHQALLKRVCERSDALGCVPAAVSFEPLPRAFFARAELPRLASRREKVAGLLDAGMQRVLMLRFNASLAAMSAEDFVRRLLVERLAVREIHVGANFHFGHKRQGDFALLERMGRDLGFEAVKMPPVLLDDERVSSSAIRASLGEGRFDDAARLLGRGFSISGRVAHGNKLGRKLGYPTANLWLGRRVSPVLGIFAVRVLVEGDATTHLGVASLGKRPTVNEVVEPLLEAHLFDFDRDIYGRRIHVEFVAHLRDEEKFDDIDLLVAQMDRDAAAARRILATSPT
ncbi:MAG: bifunctional riboflavin kinase/FAD synthetase [Rhodanobacteraceae bacterium]